MSAPWGAIVSAPADGDRPAAGEARTPCGDDQRPAAVRRHARAREAAGRDPEPARGMPGDERPAATAIATAGGAQDAGGRPAQRREPPGRRAHAPPPEVRDERRAQPAPGVVRAAHVEDAPDLGEAPGAQVARLVRVAAALGPRPQRRAGVELVLQVLV